MLNEVDEECWSYWPRASRTKSLREISLHFHENRTEKLCMMRDLESFSAPCTYHFENPGEIQVQREKRKRAREIENKAENKLRTRVKREAIS